MWQEDTALELIEVPSTLPRLFVRPSCLPKLSIKLEQLAYLKAELKDFEGIIACSWLRYKIKLLENEVNEMRKEISDRIYVEVTSVKEMMAVNELRYGSGSEDTPIMWRFRGKVYVPDYIGKYVIKAIQIVQRSKKTFLSSFE